MLSYDYFIQTSQMLMEGRRYKEYIELCEYAIASAVWPEPMKRQCEALCRWSLAEAYFYQIGDGQKAREAYTDFLRYVDSDISMIADAPSLREVMEDMYVKACTDIGQLAITYDEYFSFLRKSETARPLTQKKKEQMEAVEFNRQHNASWCDNIVQLAQAELESVESDAVARLPNAIAMYSLFLHYPETEPSIDTLNAAITNYGSLICRHISESIFHSAAKKHPANPDNYRFILERAIELVGEFTDDMETHDAAAKAQQGLSKAKSDSLDKSNFFNYGYASSAPAGVHDFIPPLVLKEQIKQNLSHPGTYETPALPGKGPSPGARPGCLAALLLLFALIGLGVFLLLRMRSS